MQMEKKDGVQNVTNGVKKNENAKKDENGDDDHENDNVNLKSVFFSILFPSHQVLHQSQSEQKTLA